MHAGGRNGRGMLRRRLRLRLTVRHPLPPVLRIRSIPTHARTSAAPRCRRCRAGLGRPMQHAVGEVDAEPVAQRAQVALPGSRRKSPASMIGGATPAAASSSYSATCCGRPMSSAVDGGARLDVGRDHLARVADQQHVAQLRDPAVVDVRQQVVGHVLLVPDRRAAGRGAEQGVDDALPVGFAGGDDLVAPGMVEPVCAR